MSDHDDDLELKAIERVLDDAFASTRPRPGFDDELWARMQARRPFAARFKDALAGLWQGVREVPGVPATAVAVVLVIALGVGLITLGGLGHRGAGTTGGALSLSQGTSRYEPNSTNSFGEFGRLPSPEFASSAGPPPQDQAPAAAAGAAPTPYLGPATVTWSGQLTLSIASAPVYRYHEPSTNVADQFASALGATFVDRPAGFLGSYQSSDYTLKVRGTVQRPPSEASYFIFAAPNLPAVSTAGSSPADIALIFLASHSLVPQWSYTTDTVKAAGNLTKVHLLRQFDVAGYAPANLVDASGNRYGIEVQLDGSRPALASGPLPINMDSANYLIIPPAQLIDKLTAVQGPVPSGAPTVKLTQAQLVYVLVPAGEQSFYEPAFLFSGTFTQKGVTYEKRLLAAAVDPSQRS